MRVPGTLAFALVAACGDNLPDPEQLLGGDNATVVDRGSGAYEHALPNLTPDQREQHNLGRGPFAFHWEVPQLGPLFNHDSCVACHVRNGRGLSEIGPDVFGSQALIRISLLDGEPAVPGGQVPVPELGLQLQDHATRGVPEGNVTLTWIETTEAFGDGESISMREPRIAVVRGNNDPLQPGVQMSYRIAPPLVGMALLEAIPDDALIAAADPDDADGDGISGRVNMAWDQESQSTRLGRFGWKASVPRLVEQVAGALVNDMGLTNAIFREPDGVTREVNDDQLVQMAFHVSTLAVPAAAPRSAEAQHGRTLFDDFGCAGCHTPTQTTGLDFPILQLRAQKIHPYTDLLLHDMGDRLLDNRADFLADGLEWRTPALWGIGLAQIVQPDATFLHDGRARTLAEAVMWHGGEAEPAKEAFRNATRADREALLAFLATL